MQLEHESKPLKPKLILLDVYVTLLDMSGMERKVNDMFNSRRGYQLWFEMFIQYSFLDIYTGQFHDFSSIVTATLQMASKIFGRETSQEQIRGILELMKQLPVKEGVQDGLSALYDQQYMLAAFTNSGERIVRERMERTGLISYFAAVISTEQIRTYKPAIEAYQWAVNKLQVPASEALLVSAHSWDIAGAANAGMQTAYVAQSNQILYPLAPKPNFQCSALPELAAQLELFYDPD